MMDSDKAREALKGVFRSKKWALKVNKMTDAQAIAIFMRLKQQQKV